MRLGRGTLRHAAAALSRLLEFTQPADETLSRYFRAHPELGPHERSFVADAAFAVLRRRRSLAAAAGSSAPQALIASAAIKALGLSARSLDGLVEPRLAEQIRAFSSARMPAAVRADLPDWLWDMLVADHGEAQAERIAQAMLNPAPLDLRVNLARSSREDARARLAAEGVEAQPTPYSPAGLRVTGKPAINRHAIFRDGLIEVQDEGSQVLAWLLGARRGEMVGDYCAGAGGKTLAIAMLMRGTGRVYAMDISARRLAALRLRAARAGVTNVHVIALSGDNDARAKRLAGKLDRVLVDAPCSGFGTLRRNPDLKWRHAPQAVMELAQKQRTILRAAARLVKPGGRLVYATCSILKAENEAIADDFAASSPDFEPLSCEAVLAEQRIPLQAGARMRLWSHLHGTDGFFAAAFERRPL
ncbi:MAG: RsmB/NOP family class I SAM-dependent RNA methyltransferase [Burkholderiales bacterium]